MPVEAQGAVELMVNFITINSGIDKSLEIQIPEVNESNSFNYMELMNLAKNKAESDL